MRLFKSSSLSLGEETDDKYSKNHMSLLFRFIEKIRLSCLSSQRSTFILFFFVKGVMSISAIMSKLFPQLVSMPNGFGPLAAVTYTTKSLT